MTVAAVVFFAVVVLFANILRAAGVGLIKTPRADALRDAAEGIQRAGRIARLLEDPVSIAPSINVTHAMLLVLAAVSGTWAASSAVEGLALFGWLVVILIVIIFIGDLIPRAMGRARPRRLAYQFVGLLEASIAFGSWAVEISDEFAEPDELDELDDEDDAEEIDLITSVLEFSETLVREVMVPRTDMVAIQHEADADAMLRIIEEEGFSRIPVVGDGIDDVVGVVFAKDLLLIMASGRKDVTAKTIARPIDFVPETKRVPDLLREMQASKSHMSIVVDEYGGTAGLVTIEDLLEELVGEIVDEFDEEEMLVRKEGDETWSVDGRLPVADLAEVAGLHLPDDEWDTVGGLVLGLAGRVPHEGEVFEIGDLKLEVTRVQGRRVGHVLATKQPTGARED